MKNLNTLKEVSGIYRIYNIISGKSYIGQSKNIKKRVLYLHLCDFNNENNCCYNSKFYQAMRKYGIDSFEIEILEECCAEVLDEKEREYIDIYDSFKNGYNSTEGGQSWGVNVHSEETQAKRLATLELTKALKDENHPRAKLSNEEVIQIRQRYIDGETCESIHRDYPNYSLETFKRIIFGRSYKGVGNIPKKDEIRHTNGKFTADQIRYIRKRYQTENISQAKIAEEFGVSAGTISGIIRGRTYTHIK